MVVRGDWKAECTQESLGKVCGLCCNLETNDKGLLECAAYNHLVLAKTLGNHKLSRR